MKCPYIFIFLSVAFTYWPKSLLEVNRDSVYLLSVCIFVQNNLFSIFAIVFYIYFPLSMYRLPNILQIANDIVCKVRLTYIAITWVSESFVVGSSGLELKGNFFLLAGTSNVSQSRNRWCNHVFNLTVWTAVGHIPCGIVQRVALHN